MPTPEEWADAGKRVSDEVRMHITLGEAGRWCAFSLENGSSDHHTYDTKNDAVRAQGSNGYRYAYVKIPFDDMPPEHAMRFLMINRQLFDAGFNLTDPDRHLIMPQTDEAMNLAVSRLVRKGLN